MTQKVSILLLCISILKEMETAQVRSSTKHSLNPRCPSGIKGKSGINFLFSHLFLVPQKDETFLTHHKEVQK